MIQITRQVGAISFAVLLMGCQSPTDQSAQQELPKVHVPQAITQLARPTTPLQELSQASVNTTIYVEGEVQQHAPLIENWLYQIADETNRLWVMSSPLYHF
ncbi:MAG: hypothetical protein F6K42_05895 [Leptolyngbya sp. SIO1D8]|nr:hypothetical protein [Leptolyngbya sp. SIO1D8]